MGVVVVPCFSKSGGTGCLRVHLVVCRYPQTSEGGSLFDSERAEGLTSRVVHLLDMATEEYKRFV